MKVEDVRKLLAGAVDDEEPVVIPTSVIAKLKLGDIPEGVSFQEKKGCGLSPSARNSSNCWCAG